LCNNEKKCQPFQSFLQIWELANFKDFFWQISKIEIQGIDRMKRIVDFFHSLQKHETCSAVTFWNTVNHCYTKIFLLKLYDLNSMLNIWSNWFCVFVFEYIISLLMLSIIILIWQRRSDWIKPAGQKTPYNVIIRLVWTKI